MVKWFSVMTVRVRCVVASCSALAVPYAHADMNKIKFGQIRINFYAVAGAVVHAWY
jgi:hypothetical protein